MTNSQRLAAVRRYLDRWLEQQGQEPDTDLRDTVLIRNGFYVGRQFQMGPFRAVWFIEEDELKIHDANGAVVSRFDVAEIERADQLDLPADKPQVIIAMPRPSEPVRHSTEIRRAA